MYAPEHNKSTWLLREHISREHIHRPGVHKGQAITVLVCTKDRLSTSACTRFPAGSKHIITEKDNSSKRAFASTAAKHSPPARADRN